LPSKSTFWEFDSNLRLLPFNLFPLRFFESGSGRVKYWAHYFCASSLRWSAITQLVGKGREEPFVRIFCLNFLFELFVRIFRTFCSNFSNFCSNFCSNFSFVFLLGILLEFCSNFFRIFQIIHDWKVKILPTNVHMYNFSNFIDVSFESCIKV
jgi:hypothetical protein